MATETQRAFVIHRDSGNAVWSLGGRFATLMSSAASDGHAALIEVLATRASEPPRHVHHREHEAWYVVDGQMTVEVGDEALVAPTGSFVFAPRGLAHTFTVDVEPTRVLILALPGGFEQFAADLGVPADSAEPPDDLAVPGPDELGPVAERYGIEVVGPPIRVARGEVPG